MVWIDTVCLVCIILFALIGIWRGFLKSLFKLCAWVGAIIGAYVAQDLLAETIATNLELSGFTVKLVCICIGFLIPFLAFSLAGHFLNKMVAGTSISKVNRILGGLLGAVKAYIICFVFLSILHILPVSGSLKDARDGALSYSVYKFSLETMGFSSEEIDIAQIAEEKATELTKQITDKAVDAAKEKAAEATESVKNAAQETAKEAVENAKAKAIEAADAAKGKASEAAGNMKEKAASTKESVQDAAESIKDKAKSAD